MNKSRVDTWSNLLASSLHAGKPIFTQYIGVCLSRLCVGSDQWDCLCEKSRQQLQRSLATMETDIRPELKDKAQTLRRKIQGLP